MLKTREELDAFRAQAAAAYKRQTQKIIICGGTGCVAGGSLKVFDRLKELIEAEGIAVELDIQKEPHENAIGLKQSGCHGFCEMGPLLRIDPQGWLYTKVKVEDCEEIVEKTIKNGEFIDRLGYSKDGTVHKKQSDIPFYHKQTRIVLEHCGRIDANSINEYIAIGGFTAFEKALFDMTGDEIVDQIREQILEGELKPDAALPSIRSLAKDLRISVITTKRAYEELEQEGFLYTVAGKGCFVAAKNPALVREEHLKRIEQHMREIVALAVPCGMDEAETARMLELIWSEEENSDERN